MTALTAFPSTFTGPQSTLRRLYIHSHIHAAIGAADVQNAAHPIGSNLRQSVSL